MDGKLNNYHGCCIYSFNGFDFYWTKNVGYTGLATELVGLAGLIGVIYTYNKGYK